jgi:hypothetical protein
MKTLTLCLTTPLGDELGRLDLPDVAIASAGELSEFGATAIDRQMPELYARIEAAIRNEGMEITLDALDFQILVSRTLLASNGNGSLQVSVPVKSRTGENTKSNPSTKPSKGTTDWEELFRIEDDPHGGGPNHE